MPDRTLTYFVSDVHLGLDVSDPADREKRFVSFLRSIPKETTRTLYLLGDIWDFWYEYDDVVPKGGVRVFAALMDLMDEGVEVKFFQGNHDIWCYKYFEDMGMEKLQQPCVVEIDGKTFCLGHGDGLGPGHFWYKVMRKGFRSPVLQWLFSLLHPYLAFKIGKGWSKKSRVARSVDYAFKGEDEPVWKFAVDFSKDRHIDYFIFGHFHTQVEMDLPEGGKLFILKDWMTPGTAPYLYFNGMSVFLGSSQNIE